MPWLTLYDKNIRGVDCSGVLKGTARRFSNYFKILQKFRWKFRQNLCWKTFCDDSGYFEKILCEIRWFKTLLSSFSISSLTTSTTSAESKFDGTKNKIVATIATFIAVNRNHIWTRFRFFVFLLYDFWRCGYQYKC